jgi:hypothetical protein
MLLMVERHTTWRGKRAHDDVHCTVATIPALPIRARTGAENARRFDAAIRAGDAELAATFKMLIYEIKEARLRQDREREDHPTIPIRASVVAGQRSPLPVQSATNPTEARTDDPRGDRCHSSIDDT